MTYGNEIRKIQRVMGRKSQFFYIWAYHHHTTTIDLNRTYYAYPSQVVF